MKPEQVSPFGRSFGRIRSGFELPDSTFGEPRIAIEIVRHHSDDQTEWLRAIRDHLTVNIEIRPEDIMEAPEFSGRGGVVRARVLFGARLPDMLDELTEAPADRVVFDQ